MRFACLLLITVLSGCEVADRSTEKQPAKVAPLVQLRKPVADQVWHRSAKFAARAVRDELANDHLEAIQLTRQALELPRHPDRNDSFGWGHATMSLSLLIDGLVEAEQWDDVIAIGHESDASVGNEYVESQRIRALALAHWQKRQLRFRSRLLIEELESLKKSLSHRIDERQDFNEINSPEDQVEIDLAFVEATQRHIDSSLTFVKQLEESAPDDASLSSLKQTCLEPEWTAPCDGPEKLEFGEGAFLVGADRVAPAFRLANAEGEMTSLADSKGRGTLVVFYLGRGCFHCAMQLKDFAPRFEEFEEKEISILGVSADTPEALANAIKAFNGRIPFTLLSDGDKKVFEQYGLIVEGQEDPLHGTFLIDPAGKVLWYDVGEHPFLDITFLLEESDRLLGQ